MKPGEVGGGAAIVVGFLILLYGVFWLFGALEILGNPTDACKTPQYGYYAGNPNACYYQAATVIVIGGILSAVGLLVVRWGWRVAERPSNLDT